MSRTGFNLRAALVAVAVTLFAFLIALTFKNSGTQPLKDPLRLNTTSISGVQIVGNYIYYKEGISLHCVDSDGDFVWNIGVDSNAEFCATKYGVAIWSYKKLTVADYKTGVTRMTKNLSNDIISAKCGSGYTAVVLSPDDNCTIEIFDRDNSQVDTISGLTELTVLEYGFFENQSLFWLMTLDSTGSLPTCTVATYKPGRSETGNITDMEQVIYKVQFRQNYIYAVGTSFMKVYDYKGTELTDMRKTVYGYTLEAVNEDSENPMMAFIPNSVNSEDFAIQDIRVIRGNSDSLIHLPVSCIALAARGNTVYGFAPNALCVAKEGQTKPAAYRLPVLIDGLIGVTDDLTAVTIYGNAIYMFKLPA